MNVVVMLSKVMVVSQHSGITDVQSLDACSLHCNHECKTLVVIPLCVCHWL
jgi:hypothetical protein